jgi:hypothetical protein
MTRPDATRLAGFVAGRAKWLIASSAALSALVFAVIVAASYRASPDLSGILSGVFAGLFASLLLLLGALGGLVWLITPKRRPEPIDMALSDELNALLAPTILDLETVRAEIREKVANRAITRVPLCAAAGLGLWLTGEFSKPSADLFGLLACMGVGGMAGYVWASQKLSESYRRLYKDRVLPQLAARFGALVYRPAQTVSVSALAQHRIFRDFDTVVADEEIAGTYRALPVSITEVLLTHGAGDDRRVVFDGLLTQIVLPRRLSGTTAVVAGEGFFGDLKNLFRQTTLSLVRLEDPAFERRYKVYSSDQVQARALLTPAFMERLMRLANSTQFQLPGILAEDNRLVVALPKDSRRNLFEPPSYRAAAGGTVLVDLTKDIDSVLKIADTIIDLDFFARSSTRPSASTLPRS